MPRLDSAKLTFPTRWHRVRAVAGSAWPVAGPRTLCPVICWLMLYLRPETCARPWACSVENREFPEKGYV